MLNRKVPKQNLKHKRQKNPQNRSGQRLPQNRSGQKLLEVSNESGKVVYRGVDRRKHREQVFFESSEGIRRFSLPKKKISKKRLRALAKIAPQKRVLRQQTFPSGRNSKHKEKEV